jgi:hypothetical protein
MMGMVCGATQPLLLMPMMIVMLMMIFMLMMIVMPMMIFMLMMIVMPMMIVMLMMIVMPMMIFMLMMIVVLMMIVILMMIVMLMMIVVLMMIVMLMMIFPLFWQGEPLYNWKNVRTAVKTMLSGELPPPNTCAHAANRVGRRWNQHRPPANHSEHLRCCTPHPQRRQRARRPARR